MAGNFVVYKEGKRNWCVELYTKNGSLIAKNYCIKSRRKAYKLVKAFYGDTEAVCNVVQDAIYGKYYVEYTAMDKYRMLSVMYSSKKSVKSNIDKFDDARFDANVLEAASIIR